MSFNVIRQIKPRRLYIAGDGSRKNIEGEDVLVNNTRQTILQMIDWECDVKTLFHPINLEICFILTTIRVL